MPVPNPLYKPDWEAIYESRKAEYNRLGGELKKIGQEVDRLYEANRDDPALEILAEQRDILNEAHDKQEKLVNQYIKMQYPTIQEYAAALFHDFNPAMSASSLVSISSLDIENFKTIEEVDEAWVEARDAAEREDVINKYSLPIGKPAGQDIFTHVKGNHLQSGWQEFYLGRNAEAFKVMMTIDQRNDENHICFMTDPEQRGRFVIQNVISALATEIYYRAINAQHQTASRPALPNSDLTISQSFAETASKSQMQPDQFNFYIHRQPLKYSKEEFVKVKMDFVDEKFCNPHFEPYEVIPHAVQQAFKTQTARSVHNDYSRPELP